MVFMFHKFITCVWGLCGLGQLSFHVLSSLALLDMESDGVNDGALWFLGLNWWEVSIHQNSMNGKKYSPVLMERGISISKNGQ
jgi:hypothetical protein